MSAAVRLVLDDAPSVPLLVSAVHVTGMGLDKPAVRAPGWQGSLCRRPTAGKKFRNRLDTWQCRRVDA